MILLKNLTDKPANKPIQQIFLIIASRFDHFQCQTIRPHNKISVTSFFDKCTSFLTCICQTVELTVYFLQARMTQFRIAFFRCYFPFFCQLSDSQRIVFFSNFYILIFLRNLLFFYYVN